MIQFYCRSYGRLNIFNYVTIIGGQICIERLMKTETITEFDVCNLSTIANLANCLKNVKIKCDYFGEDIICPLHSNGFQCHVFKLFEMKCCDYIC